MTADTTPESLPYTPTTDEVRATYYSSPDNRDWEASLAAAFDRWLASHDAEVARKAVCGAADDLAEHFPHDLFLPLTREDHELINATLDEHAGISRDRISADMMRRAEALIRARAEQIGENRG